MFARKVCLSHRSCIYTSLSLSVNALSFALLLFLSLSLRISRVRACVCAKRLSLACISARACARVGSCVHVREGLSNLPCTVTHICAPSLSLSLKALSFSLLLFLSLSASLRVFARVRACVCAKRLSPARIGARACVRACARGFEQPALYVLFHIYAHLLSPPLSLSLRISPCLCACVRVRAVCAVTRICIRSAGLISTSAGSNGVTKITQLLTSMMVTALRYSGLSGGNVTRYNCVLRAQQATSFVYTHTHTHCLAPSPAHNTHTQPNLSQTDHGNNQKHNSKAIWSHQMLTNRPNKTLPQGPGGR